MSYETDKANILAFFDNHIIRYVVSDLEALNSIEADETGAGGCSIPQASATFSALDLMGYLMHPQDISPMKMSFSDLLNNEKYFPEFKQYSIQANFFNSFKDNLRSFMVHRFSITKYDITKTSDTNLFTEMDTRQIFNTSYFTKITINAINKIYNEIKEDKFLINGFSKKITLGKVNEKIKMLKGFDKNYVPLIDLPISSVSTQTTCSLK